MRDSRIGTLMAAGEATKPNVQTLNPLWSKKSCVGLKSKVTVMVSGVQACS